MHKLFNYLDTEGLIELFLLANTPVFVYKNFQRNQSILEIASNFESSELIDVGQSLLDKEKKDPNEWILLYSVIMALTLKALDDKIIEFFSKVKMSQIKWGEKIVDLFFDKFKVYQEIMMDIPTYKVHFQIHNIKSDTEETLTF